MTRISALGYQPTSSAIQAYRRHSEALATNATERRADVAAPATNIPQFFVFKRFLPAIISGAKKQLLVPGKRTKMPGKGEPFTLAFKGDDGERHVFADGVSSAYASGVYIVFDDAHATVELGYVEWDGEEDCQRALVNSAELDEFAVAEGFANWAAMKKFMSRDQRTWRGHILTWGDINLKRETLAIA